MLEICKKVTAITIKCNNNNYCFLVIFMIEKSSYDS